MNEKYISRCFYSLNSFHTFSVFFSGWFNFFIKILIEKLVFRCSKCFLFPEFTVCIFIWAEISYMHMLYPLSQKTYPSLSITSQVAIIYFLQLVKKISDIPCKCHSVFSYSPLLRFPFQSRISGSCLQY